MKFAAIDIETTGLNSELHSVIEVAVIVGDTEKRAVDPREAPTFQSIIIPHDLASWSIGAMAMHRKSGLLDEILKGNVHEFGESEVYGRLWQFFKDNFPGRIVATGKNFSGFDRKFLDKMGNFGFHHRSIDPTHWYIRSEDTEPPSLSECLKRADMEDSVNHRAYDDALAVYRLVQWGFPLTEV